MKIVTPSEFANAVATIHNMDSGDFRECFSPGMGDYLWEVFEDYERDAGKFLSYLDGENLDRIWNFLFYHQKRWRGMVRLKDYRAQ